MSNEWKRQLRREASAHHMCADNRHDLERVDSKIDAIRLYKKTIDWALEENYPALSTIRRDFSDCQPMGIYVDHEFHGETLDEQQVYVFHNCRGVIKTGLNADKRIIPMLYFANGCDMAVQASGPALTGAIRVPLYVFGPNKVSAEHSKDLECITYKYNTK